MIIDVYKRQITLCVKLSAFFVISTTDDPAFLYDDRTDQGIGICESASSFCQLDSQLHIDVYKRQRKRRISAGQNV